MMTRRRQLTLAWLGVLVALLIALILFRQILLPFAAGAVLAYALDPLADRLETWGWSRLWATATIMIVIFFFLALIVVLVLPLLINQLLGFIGALPGFAVRIQEMIAPALDSEWAKYLGIDAESIRASLSNLTSRGVDIATTLAGSVWTGGRVVVDVVSLLVITPFVAFYLLRDWDILIGRIERLFPLDQVQDIRELAREVDRKVAAFFRGQLLVSLILGLFYAAGLLAIGLNYGLLIGLGAGVLSFIPYLGFTIGFVLSIVVALVQFWPDWIWIAAVVLVFMIGQLLEGYILQPRLIGRSVGMHPVWLIFVLFAFGLLFGFVGVLVAIPASAAAGVILRFVIERYRDSPFYRGNEPTGTV